MQIVDGKVFCSSQSGYVILHWLLVSYSHISCCIVELWIYVYYRVKAIDLTLKAKKIIKVCLIYQTQI